VKRNAEVRLPEADAAYVRSVEERRERSRAALRGPQSTLAAIARHELPVGSRLRFGADTTADVRLDGFASAVVIEATRDGFIVDGEPSGPRTVSAGRYSLRLSHQNYPAVVVLDAQSPRLEEEVELRWYPVDPALRIRTRLEPDDGPQAIASTASGDRPATRLGWLRFVVDGRECRLLATRLLEPGFVADHIDVYFRDATTGDGSYEVGRYVTVEREGDDVILDFNLAYNPSCALSPYYNCPIPPAENRLTAPIRAGEMSPFVGSH
jgi:uncharacterized protein (DUF1684 family)